MSLTYSIPKHCAYPPRTDENIGRDDRRLTFPMNNRHHPRKKQNGRGEGDGVRTVVVKSNMFVYQISTVAKFITSCQHEPACVCVR